MDPEGPVPIFKKKEPEAESKTYIYTHTHTFLLMLLRLCCPKDVFYHSKVPIS
jgi:hypothetical protein